MNTEFFTSITEEKQLKVLKFCPRCKRWVALEAFKLKYYLPVDSNSPVRVYVGSYCKDCYRIHYPCFRRSAKSKVQTQELKFYSLDKDAVVSGKVALERAIENDTLPESIDTERREALAIWYKASKCKK